MSEKIPVMIVDDEKLALEDFSTLVDWEALGFRIVAKAFNGKQALARFQQYRPRIVFTDIKMPIIDGIVLCQEIRKLDQAVKLLLLTAYEDFTYAKAAISLGVTDYIIKSEVTPRSLTDKLTSLREQIDRQSQNQNILMDKLVENYLADRVTEAEDPALFQKRFSFLLVEQATPLNLSGEPWPAGYLISQGNIVSCLNREEFAPFRRVAACPTDGQRALITLEMQESSLGTLRRELQQSAAAVAQTLRDTFARRFTVYWSSTPQSLRQWKENVRACQRAFSRRYFTEGDRSITRLEPPAPPAQETPVTLNGDMLREMLDAKDTEKLSVYLHSLYADVRDAGNLQNLNGLSRELLAFVRASTASLPAESDRPDLSLKGNLEHWATAASICEWMLACLQRVVREQRQAEDQRYSPSVTMAKQYIHRHYQHAELSLSDVAQSVNMSVGYLCTQFKQETGTTLRRYISNVRIDAAKKLLGKGNLKVNEVYKAVGYSSSQYFSQAFFKIAGVYPNEYRKGEVPQE
ncbi:MAG: response regulator [Eubacteriales bacterium]|nr:response regulator [Eubacteriales bacterium]